MELNRCKQDLLTVGSYTIQQISCPYNLAQSWETSMINVYTKFKEKLRQSRSQRIMVMVYAYYLGELIDITVTPREKWLEFVQTQQISGEYHYYRGITRTYQLFKQSVEQIYYTSYLSYRKILDLKSNEYRELVYYNQTINDLNLNLDEL